MNVITLLNEKGGVGKTTLAIHIAAGLAIGGKRVVLLDTDPQAHTTLSLGCNKRDSLYQLLHNEAEWRDVLVGIAAERWGGVTGGELLLLPGDISTVTLPQLVSDATLLRERLEELEGRVDVVVIDTSPTPGLMQSMYLWATTHVVIPTESELLSLDGVASTLKHVGNLDKQRLRGGLPPTRLIGVQPTMFRANTLSHAHGLGMMRDNLPGAVLEPIAQRTAWTDASHSQQTLFAYAPDSAAAREAWQLVNAVEVRCG